MKRSPPPSPPHSVDDEETGPEDQISRLQNARRTGYMHNPFRPAYERSGSSSHESIFQQSDKPAVNALTDLSQHLCPIDHYLESTSDQSFEYISQEDLSTHTGAVGGEDGVVTRARSLSHPPPVVGRPQRPVNKTRVLSEPRFRRKATNKAPKNAAPIITAPVSELTKDMHHIAIKNIEEWVQRPTEERHLEDEKAGKIRRPMNSFMLYRSAYANRIKQWCAQNNHQVVSCVSGQSWPLEPPEIRGFYERCAVVERDNHQRAHPDYKFSPNKTPAPPKKRITCRGNPDRDDDMPEDRSRSISPVRKRAKSCGVDSSYDSRASTPFDSSDLLLPENSNRPSWHYTWPSPHVAHVYPSQPHSVLTHHNIPGLANSYYNSSGNLVGIPSTVHHHELLPPYSHSANLGHDDNPPLDPQLLAVDNNALNTSISRPFSQDPYHLWQHESDGNHFLQGSNSTQFGFEVPAYSGLPAMEEGQAGWSFNHAAGSAEAGKEFDQWLNAHNSTI